jgi:hypothetical protein
VTCSPGGSCARTVRRTWPARTLCATPNSQPRADPRRVERAPGGERLQPGLGQQIVCGAGHPPREVAVQGRRVLLDQGA